MRQADTDNMEEAVEGLFTHLEEHFSDDAEIRMVLFAVAVEDDGLQGVVMPVPFGDAPEREQRKLVGWLLQRAHETLG